METSKIYDEIYSNVTHKGGLMGLRVCNGDSRTLIQILLRLITTVKSGPYLLIFSPNL